MTACDVLRISRIGFLVLALAGGGCLSPEDPGRRAFAEQFVRSVAAGTDFYERHLAPEGEAATLRAQSLISEDFEIVGWDRFFLHPGSFEYYYRFGNGATGVLYVFEQDGDRRAYFDARASAL